MLKKENIFYNNSIGSDRLEDSGGAAGKLVTYGTVKSPVWDTVSCTQVFLRGLEGAMAQWPPPLSHR